MPAAWTAERLRELWRDAPPLAEALPWCWVEPDTLPIHVLADGSLGLGWELRMPNVELEESGERLRVRTAIEHFLHQLPPRVAFQLVLAQWPHVGPALARWSERRQASALTNQMLAARARHLGALAEDPFFAVKSVRLLLTLRWWPDNERRPRTGLSPFEALALARDRRRHALGLLMRLNESVQTLGRALGAPPAAVDGAGLLEFCWRLLNPEATGAPPPWDPRQPLRAQVTETAASFRRDGFTLGGLAGTIVAVHRFPEETWPGHLTLGREPGGTNPLLARPGFGWVSLAGVVFDHESGHGQINLKRQFAFTQRLGVLGSSRVDAERMYQELSMVLDQSFTAGLRLCQVQVTAVQYDRPDRIDRRTAATLDAFAQLGFRAQREQMIAEPLWLASLPFGYDPRLEYESRRARRVLSRNLADVLPCYGGFQGTPTPAQLFLTRTGLPVFFDPFDSAVGAHIALSGITGSGKSFTAIDLILQHLSLGADVVVLDKGDSYRRLAELMGGQYVAMEPATMPTLNPCAGPGDADHQRFVANLLAEMASRGLDRFTLDPEMDGVLSRAVAQAFAAAPEGQELTLSDVARALTSPDTDSGGLGSRLTRMLFPFLQGGQSGRFFDGPNGFVLRPGLTVIELKELDRDPALQRIVLMVVLHGITTFFASRPRWQRKFIVIDEAWSLMKSEYAARILEIVARTYRKLGTCGVFISQFITDFDGPAGKAIAENCPNRIFLRQELDALRRVQAALGFSDAQLGALASATSAPGRYSEALLVTPAGRGMVRIVTDPLTYWVATTHPNDLERWARALAEAGQDPARALARLLDADAAAATPQAKGA